MAERPEPLAELLPRAERIVVAEVLEVLGPTPKASPPPRPGPIGSAEPLPAQRVRLKVLSTLRGAEATEVVAVKPVSAYVLAPGHHGPFLLDGGRPEPEILGRYGPDTYPLPALEQALASTRR